MANLAHAMPDGVSWFEEPPDQLLPLLVEDRLGTGILRL
ncbi:hypothetical protein CCACVL1_29847 [Corchorus capsularis]|uniref:Uncharacterized protein n=1 Tax=Corchorus capsularis TaxID=210143 RepID=A0A1R3FZW2_COCAP|nr:hypothetical protein CCACVL1_29847 [Corchorus capsularis]